MHSVLKEAADLQKLKAQDYNSKNSEAKEEYFPYGDLSYLQMIQTKVKRIEAVVTSKENINFESAYDSVLDLINYASFYGAYLKNKNDNK